MAKDDRLYARFDIGMDEHPKIALLSDAAFRALFEATLYSRRQMTDGFLAAGVAMKKWGRKPIAELCSNDPERPSLYERNKGGVAGYQIHDFEKHQTTTADIEKRRESGRLGGLAKASNGLAPATESVGQKASNTLAKTETETETTTTDVVVKTPPLDSMFEAAWIHWPKKVEKEPARAAFKVAARSVAPHLLSDHIRRFGAAYAATTENKFVPALGRWLGKKRWTDDLPVATPGVRPPTRTEQNLDVVRQYAAQTRQEIES